MQAATQAAECKDKGKTPIEHRAFERDGLIGVFIIEIFIIKWVNLVYMFVNPCIGWDGDFGCVIENSFVWFVVIHYNGFFLFIFLFLCLFIKNV